METGRNKNQGRIKGRLNKKYENRLKTPKTREGKTEKKRKYGRTDKKKDRPRKRID